jgi:predicted kinase
MGHLVKAEILIGMIASGKSSYCAKRARDGAIIINNDSIVEMLHGGDYHLYDKQVESIYKSIEEHIFSITMAAGRDVVIDRTGLSKGVRARFISMAKSRGYQVIGIIFPMEGPDVHAKRRAESDGRGYDFDYWRRIAGYHMAGYQPPGMEEGFHSLCTFDFKTMSTKVDRDGGT